MKSFESLEQVRQRIEEIIQLHGQSFEEIKIESFQILGAREDQQDTIAHIVEKNEVLAVLGDGIGGMEKGDMASAIGVCSVLSAYSPNSDIHMLLEGFQDADDEICHMVETNHLKGSGSTLVAVYIKDRKLYMCSVGDSYVYLFRNRVLKRLNVSLNYEYFLHRLLDENKITEEDYKLNEHKKNMLISFLGKGDLSIIDFFKEPLELEKHDLIFLCSDGVIDAVSEKKLEQVLAENKNPSTIRETLKNMILLENKANQDNASAIVICMNG